MWKVTRKKQVRERRWINQVKRRCSRSLRRHINRYQLWWEVATWTKMYMRGGDSFREALWHALREWDL